VTLDHPFVLGAQPWRCLWRGFSQITMTRPWRRITLHLSQIGLTLGLTFIDQAFRFGCYLYR
jgi:hypothetical protein